MAKETKSDYDKFKSRRWIITIWCLFIITAIIIMGYVFKDDSFSGLAMTLSAVPVAYTSLETVKKWKVQQNQEEDQEKTDAENHI